MNFKKIVSFVLVGFSCLSVFALPGVKRVFEDANGEYVYYKDYSFERETYVGFLFYDESTYQIRYYAPADKKQKLPEKEISFYVTVNPESSFWDMTGERVISTILPDTDDVTILNYLHDLLYEFSARRIKAGEIVSFDKNVISQDFEQFGGNVKISFDNLIPIFNIKSILDFENKAQFECCATGRLSSSQDQSFNQFAGFDEKKKYSNGKKIKSKETNKYLFNTNQEITLDENWVQQMENSWTFGDDSFLVMAEFPKQFSDKKDNYCFMIRKLIESVDGLYSDFGNILISEENDGYKVTLDSFLLAKKSYIHSVYIFNKKEDGNVLYFSMSTYYDKYCQNKAYYDNIVKTYKIN